MTFKAFFVMAAAVAACVSCSEKSEPEPERVATLAGDYGTVATCITLGWSTIGKVRLQFDHPNSEGMILLYQDPPNGQVTVETLVRQVSQRRVRVASRLPDDPIGNHFSGLWDTVEGCAQA